MQAFIAFFRDYELLLTPRVPVAPSGHRVLADGRNGATYCRKRCDNLKKALFYMHGVFPHVTLGEPWKQLNSLQYGRAFAASAVVAHHSMLAAAQFRRAAA